MNCRNADTLIQHSLDMPLSPAERARLDAHLASCDACRRLWDEYRRVSLVSAAWTRRSGTAELTPEEFAAQVLSRLAATPSPADRMTRRPLLAGGLLLILLAVLSPLAAPLLPSVGGWHVSWDLPAAPNLQPWLRAFPSDMLGLWRLTTEGLASARWTVLLVLAALPVNAVLCLRARRDARRAA